MKPDDVSFGAEENEYFPALSDGAEVKFNMTTAPEKYESLYGEKIRIGIKVTGINPEAKGVQVNKEYTVSSSAVCWKEYYQAWHNPNQSDKWEGMCMACVWAIRCVIKNDKTMYKLRALEEVN